MSYAHGASLSYVECALSVHVSRIVHLSICSARARNYVVQVCMCCFVWFICLAFGMLGEEGRGLWMGGY